MSENELENLVLIIFYHLLQNQPITSVQILSGDKIFFEQIIALFVENNKSWVQKVNSSVIPS